VVKKYVAETGVSFLSVDYRLAPEFSYDALSEDVLTGLRWMLDHSTQLHVDKLHVGLMGDSAGGGIAAGAAILSRDRGIPVSRQILVYPMLDDRNQVPLKSLEPYIGWNWEKNFTGWNTLFGRRLGSDCISPAVGPARLIDAAGLPKTYIEVGELDIFREEGIAYAQKLMQAGVPTELHVHAGAPHVFDRIAPTAAISQRALADRFSNILAV